MNYKTLNEIKKDFSKWYNMTNDVDVVDDVFGIHDGMFEIGEKFENYNDIVVSYLIAKQRYFEILGDNGNEFHYITYDGSDYHVVDFVGNRLNDIYVDEIVDIIDNVID